MNNNKLSLGSLIVYAITTSIKIFIIIAVVIFVIAIVMPFVLFGPNDLFRISLLSGNNTYDSRLAEYYFNILQWLALALHS